MKYFLYKPLYKNNNLSSKVSGLHICMSVESRARSQRLILAVIFPPRMLWRTIWHPVAWVLEADYKRKTFISLWMWNNASYSQCLVMDNWHLVRGMVKLITACEDGYIRHAPYPLSKFNKEEEINKQTPKQPQIKRRKTGNLNESKKPSNL